MSEVLYLHQTFTDLILLRFSGMELNETSEKLLSLPRKGPKISQLTG